VKPIKLAFVLIVLVAGASWAEDLGEKPIKAGTESAIKVALSKARILSPGKYESLTFVNKLQVSAAMLSNPDRLKNVEFANIYDLKKVKLSAGVVVELFDAQASGKLAFTTQSADGNYFVPQAVPSGAPYWGYLGSNSNCSTEMESPENFNLLADCKKQFNDWLLSDTSETRYVISTSNNLVDSQPFGKVINWEAAGWSEPR
jgi:hypothetical protein